MPHLANIIWNIFRMFEFGPVLLRIHPRSALLSLGWFKSFKTNHPVDRNGNPLPWWTYSIISFLDDRLCDHFRVLEFGCGYSSLWLSNRVSEVISVENNKLWANHIKSKAPNNLKIIACHSLKDFFGGFSKKYAEFNILVIDAGDRMELAEDSLSMLSEDGVVIWDDTERPDWPKIKKYMKTFGYLDLSFTGLKPQVIHLSRTTIFYKEKNCLGI